jgi:carboxyl-terminal processing protease
VTSQAPLHNIEQPIKQNKTNKPFVYIIISLLIFSAGLGVGIKQRDLVKPKQVSKSLSNDLDYSSVEAVYDELRTNFDGKLDQEKLLNGLKAGLASASGDQFTEYMDPKEAQSFNDDLNGSFTGIGAELGKNNEGNIEIISPIAGFPAEKSGLRSKDVIAEINGTSAVGITVSDAVSKIRGEEGSQVKLKIVRDKAESLDFDITRAKISIPSVKSEITGDNIGILTISRYGSDTSSLAREAANKFKSANVRGVILDLRGDPGGLLDAAQNVSSLWLDSNQTVLLEKRDDVVIKKFQANGNPVLKGIKTVVLIDGGSASASEITAGALQDNKVATVIGEKSYGKGSVQQLINLKDGGVLKVTSAHWFTPSGKGITKIGIKPDREVKRTDDDFKNKRDPQLNAALEFINK